jgi:hypothetical protein
MQKYLEERGTEPGAHQEEGNKLVPARERRGGLGGRGTMDGDRELGAEDAELGEATEQRRRRELAARTPAVHSLLASRKEERRVGGGAA